MNPQTAAAKARLKYVEEESTKRGKEGFSEDDFHDEVGRQVGHLNAMVTVLSRECAALLQRVEHLEKTNRLLGGTDG